LKIVDRKSFRTSHFPENLYFKTGADFRNEIRPGIVIHKDPSNKINIEFDIPLLLSQLREEVDARISLKNVTTGEDIPVSRTEKQIIAINTQANYTLTITVSYGNTSVYCENTDTIEFTPEE
jgi:hypothetical protein